MAAKGVMGPHGRVLHHAKAAKPLVCLHPRPQRFLVKLPLQRLGRLPIQRGQPRAHLRIGRALDGQIQQRRLGCSDIGRHLRPAPRFEIGGAAQIERVKRGQIGLHLG